MPTPPNWNVVVVGAWNLAILTPAGISRLLLGLDPSVPVEVLVPMEHQATIHVVHDGLIVSPSVGRLIVAPTTPSWAGLRRAAEIARTALAELRLTPVSAAGLNLRFTFDSMPFELLDVLSSSLDDRLSDAGYHLVGRTQKRSLAWEGGVLNIELQSEADASGSLLLNFHRQASDHAVLEHWFGLSDQMRVVANHLLGVALRSDLSVEE